MALHDERCFLEAIAASPNDAAVYLVFSDWLLEHGRDQECAWERWRARLARRPRDPVLREKYAQWLLEAGQGDVARTHFLIARILRGDRPFEVVVARSGFIKHASDDLPFLDAAARRQLLAEVRSAMNRVRDAQVVIVRMGFCNDDDLDLDEDYPPGDRRRSPLLTLDRDDGRVRRVRPQQLSAETDDIPYRCPFCTWEPPGDDPSYLLSSPCRHFCGWLVFDDRPPYGAEGGLLVGVNDLALSAIARPAERVALAADGCDGLDVSDMPERFQHLFEHFEEGPLEDGESPYSEAELGRALTTYLSRACRDADPCLCLRPLPGRGFMGCYSELAWSVNPKHTLRMLRGVIRRDKQVLRELLASVKNGQQRGPCS